MRKTKPQSACDVNHKELVIEDFEVDEHRNLQRIIPRAHLEVQGLNGVMAAVGRVDGLNGVKADEEGEDAGDGENHLALAESSRTGLETT